MDAESLVSPRRPRFAGWRRITGKLTSLDELGYPYERWAHDASGLFVISAVEVVRDPGQPDIGPEFHLSVSAAGQRCTAADAVWVLGQFGLEDATEDNHVPCGIARNFWRPVADHLSGYECACQKSEPAIREDRGDYVWRGVPHV